MSGHGLDFVEGRRVLLPRTRLDSSVWDLDSTAPCNGRPLRHGTDLTHRYVMTRLDRTRKCKVPLFRPVLYSVGCDVRFVEIMSEIPRSTYWSTVPRPDCGTSYPTTLSKEGPLDSVVTRRGITGSGFVFDTIRSLGSTVTRTYQVQWFDVDIRQRNRVMRFRGEEGISTRTRHGPAGLCFSMLDRETRVRRSLM